MPVPTVPRKNGVVRENIMTHLMHLDYTTHMNDVDMADHCGHPIVCRTALTNGSIGFFLLTKYDCCKYVHHLFS
jgi:hypothetical protein